MQTKMVMLVIMAMMAFAGNSLLCRMALVSSSTDPVSFTYIRLLSGALVLYLLTVFRHSPSISAGSWVGAVALFVYATGFSLAYVAIPTGAGALLLFGAVQLTMILWGMFKGERFNSIQTTGFFLAIVGLTVLLLPGATAPPLSSAVLMVMAGMAWGIYSVLGRSASNPLSSTAGNFILTLPFAAILLLINTHTMMTDLQGLILGIVSGAVTSGIGYALWYAVLPALKSSHAATIQLSVPVIATFAGWLILGETLTLRILLASLAILSGIALVIIEKR
ncbi:DMT family transporter [Alteromonas pelagimontana]|uniref:DMT family transporter n=1 Tax=Alteromonas pelagimontana TaxID=1858656 RepID=A0A6M4M9Q1_9ALTE|nr:DMT family transporter [Alteromonas pelagimontana]QJR79365.1 DMT family transporter [Alteromonas pelagimontana]